MAKGKKTSKTNVPALPDQAGSDVASTTDVAAFFGQVGPGKAKERVPAPASPTPLAAAAPTPRLVFAMDATASRAPTWSAAQQVQAEMFQVMSGKGQVQLCAYGGNRFRASRWAADAQELAGEMAAVSCVAGHTQVHDLLLHLERETGKARVAAACLVTDTLEEKAHELLVTAGRLKMLGVRLFVFHEIGNERASSALRAIAEATGGAYARFNEGHDAAAALRPLLGAVAAFAEGGRRALEAYAKASGSPSVAALARQLQLEGPKS